MIPLRHSLAFGLLGILASLPAWAQGRPAGELLQPPARAVDSPISDRFFLRASWLRPTVHTDIRYDASPILPGTPFRAEDTLGLAGRLDQGWVEVGLRPTPRQRIRAGFYQMSRKGEAVLTEVVQFGGGTYEVSDRVTSAMKLQLLDLAYSYSLLRREVVEIGVGLGVHLLQAEGRAAVPARRLGEAFDVSGPFASAGVDGTWRITRRLAATAQVQYMPADLIDIEDMEGSYLRTHVDVQWRWRANLAFGLGYTRQVLRIDSTDARFPGRVALQAAGPELFVRASF